jgi:transposase-like protein
VARKYERHSLEFKKEAVARMKVCDSTKSLAKELGINRRLLYRWREELGGQVSCDPAEINPAVIGQLRLVVARLKEALTEETLKARFFSDALQRVEARRSHSSSSGATPCTTKSEQ